VKSNKVVLFVAYTLVGLIAASAPLRAQQLQKPGAKRFSLAPYCLARPGIQRAPPNGKIWSTVEAEQARDVMFRLAEKHRVGFFDVSAGDGGVWLSASSGDYLRVHGDGAEG
jgi:hypothetical protein